MRSDLMTRMCPHHSCLIIPFRRTHLCGFMANISLRCQNSTPASPLLRLASGRIAPVHHELDCKAMTHPQQTNSHIFPPDR